MDVEDYFDVLRRHRGWIVGPTFAGLVIAVVVAFIWPDTYVSDALIRIVPSSVPERYVPSNLNLQVSQRIAAISQQVRSRGNLQSLINQNGLYPRKKGRVPEDDVIEQMQKDIDIQQVRALREQDPASTALRASISVSFAYENRYLAQKVVNQIVAMMVNETIRTSSSESVMTTEFLRDKVTAAKKNLDAIENRLAEYKLKFAGKLPDQLASNIQQLNTLSTLLATNTSSINRASQDKLMLENQLRTAREQLDAAPTAPAGAAEMAARNERLIQLEREITQQESELSKLREQYRDTHPDVRRGAAELERLRKSRQSLLKEEEQKVAAVPQKKEAGVRTREQRQLEAEAERLQAQIQAKDMEMDLLLKEQARLDKSMKQYQERIESSPLGERQYALLTRDYSLAKQEYESLKSKESQSAMATDLETRKQGELLEVLEQASLPQTPKEPNRWYIVGTGVLSGLLLGMFLAGGREMKDTSLKNLKDVRAYTGLPVLGSVPLVQSDVVVQRRRRLVWLAWSTACIVGFVLMLGSVYNYFTKGS
jgi:polysaccharide chain length determinant protein (PEP-CTERM system associated)